MKLLYISALFFRCANYGLGVPAAKPPSLRCGARYSLGPLRGLGCAHPSASLTLNAALQAGGDEACVV